MVEHQPIRFVSKMPELDGCELLVASVDDTPYFSLSCTYDDGQTNGMVLLGADHGRLRTPFVTDDLPTHGLASLGCEFVIDFDPGRFRFGDRPKLGDIVAIKSGELLLCVNSDRGYRSVNLHNGVITDEWPTGAVIKQWSIALPRTHPDRLNVVYEHSTNTASRKE